MTSHFGTATVGGSDTSDASADGTGGTLRRYMTVVADERTVVRFGAFEVDLQTGELHKHGMRVRLQEQPFRILAMLLERPGELVTRDEIKERLWPADTFVDFEHSVNAAIRRLRDALNDHADTPRFIETLPRRGYRFIADVSESGEGQKAAHAVTIAAPPAPPVAIGRMQRLLMIAAVLVMFAVAVPLNVPRASIDSIAILPFVNETNDASLDYLADGIPARVIDELSNASQLRVASRNSAFTFHGKVNTKDAASALHVRALLVGSLRKSADTLQLTAELVDAKDDQHLWGATYSISAAQSGNVESAIAREVANHLRQPITRKNGAVNPIAFDACLRGDHLMDVRTNESFRQALEFFNKAADADRNYAPAYAAMSKAYGLLAWYGGMPASEALPLQEAAADRALQLDPNNALALINKVAALGNYHRNPNAAEPVLQRAMEVAPNDPVVQEVYSIGMRRLGRFEAAITAAKRAEELDPVWKSYATLRVQVYYDARRYDDAIRLRNERPSLNSEHVLYALVFSAAGHKKEALAELSEIPFDERATPYTLCAAAQAYARAGDAARGRELLKLGLERQQRLGTETMQGCSPYDAAAAYAALGERDEMFAALNEADRTLDSKLQWIKMDPAFDPYRHDPAFQDVVKRESTPR